MSAEPFAPLCAACTQWTHAPSARGLCPECEAVAAPTCACCHEPVKALSALGLCMRCTATADTQAESYTRELAARVGGIVRPFYDLRADRAQGVGPWAGGSLPGRGGAVGGAGGMKTFALTALLFASALALAWMDARELVGRDSSRRDADSGLGVGLKPDPHYSDPNSAHALRPGERP